MLVSTSLSLMALASTVVATKVCSLADSGDFSCLSSISAASSYCTKILRSAQASTVTKTVEAGSQATVTAITIESIFVTEGATSTIWVTSVISKTAKKTVTTYIPATVAKRAASSCNRASALSALSVLDSSDLSTICSCLNAVPSATTLATARVAGLTVTEGAAATTTITGEVHFTVAPSSTLSTTVTSSFTDTSTVSLVAPSFTQVFGPEAGCVDMEPVSGDSLDTDIGQDEAISTCQDRCAQISTCSFVYVQLSFPNFNIVPFYKCFYNNHTLDEATDIQCGNFLTIWGDATGYNAIGRGV